MTEATPRKKPDILCTATNRWGGPCQRPPIRGGTVCATHGGRAPQIKRRAQQRLDENADKAAYALVQMMQDTAIPPAVRLNAMRDLLDRAGLSGKQQVEVSVRTWEDVLEGVLVDVEEPTDIEDAIVVPDLPEIEQRDLDMIDRERERNKERRRAARKGLTDHEPPTVNAQPKPEMASEARKEYEAFLLKRISAPEPTPPTRRRRKP